MPCGLQAVRAAAGGTGEAGGVLKPRGAQSLCRTPENLEPSCLALKGLDLSQRREKALREQIESFLMTD